MKHTAVYDYKLEGSEITLCSVKITFTRADGDVNLLDIRTLTGTPLPFNEDYSFYKKLNTHLQEWT